MQVDIQSFPVGVPFDLKAPIAVLLAPASRVPPDQAGDDDDQEHQTGRTNNGTADLLRQP